jgi:hypothetical protein
VTDAFSQLVFEKERTQFVFYGFRSAVDSKISGNYYKQAYSLNEALEDLNANPGVLEDAHLVLDAFVQMEEGNDPWVHVQVAGAEEVLAKVRGEYERDE